MFVQFFWLVSKLNSMLPQSYEVSWPSVPNSSFLITDPEVSRSGSQPDVEPRKFSVEPRSWLCNISFFVNTLYKENYTEIVVTNDFQAKRLNYISLDRRKVTFMYVFLCILFSKGHRGKCFL